MGGKWPRRLVAGLSVAVVVAVLAGCGGQAPPASGPEGIVATITTPPRTTTSSPSAASSPTSGTDAGSWYLALGDSLAAGMQPTTGDQPQRGYAGPVLSTVRQTAPSTALKNLGCSGETTTSMLKGGLCRYPEGSQLAAAVAFLKANGATTRVVTLDIGANDVLRCARPAIDQTCATTTTTGVAQDLGAILGQIRAVAPTVPIVLLNYYNPLLAGYRQGADGRKIAADSQPLLARLNAVIADSAKAADAKVADVSAAFSTTTETGSPEPVNVQRVCAWTWMCSRNDIHANDDGYAAMAKAVAAVL